MAHRVFRIQALCFGIGSSGIGIQQPSAGFWILHEFVRLRSLSGKSISEALGVVWMQSVDEMFKFCSSQNDMVLSRDCRNGALC